MPNVSELRAEANRVDAESFARLHGPLALVHRPDHVLIERALLAAGLSRTVLIDRKPDLVAEFFIMLRAFSTLEVQFLSSSGGEALQLGRGPECSMRVQERSVSRVHASLLPSSGSWVVRPHPTRNGTFINSERIEQDTALSDGDTLALGDLQLIFVTSQTLHSQLLGLSR